MPRPSQEVLGLTVGGSGLELRDQLLRRLQFTGLLACHPHPIALPDSESEPISAPFNVIFPSDKELGASLVIHSRLPGLSRCCDLLLGPQVSVLEPAAGIEEDCRLIIPDPALTPQMLESG